MILVFQMVAAVMQEDRYEVSLTISFVMAGQEKRQVGTLSYGGWGNREDWRGSSACPAVRVTWCVCSQVEAAGGGGAVSGAETLSSVTERAALGKNASPGAPLKTDDFTVQLMDSGS